jgi:IS5 family transposase
LLQAFYGIRSERLLLEQLHYNLLFRWFVGLSPDDPIWHPTTFTLPRPQAERAGGTRTAIASSTRTSWGRSSRS